MFQQHSWAFIDHFVDCRKKIFCNSVLHLHPFDLVPTTPLRESKEVFHHPLLLGNARNHSHPSDGCQQPASKSQVRKKPLQNEMKSSAAKRQMPVPLHYVKFRHSFLKFLVNFSLVLLTKVPQRHSKVVTQNKC